MIAVLELLLDARDLLLQEERTRENALALTHLETSILWYQTHEFKMLNPDLDPFKCNGD